MSSALLTYLLFIIVIQCALGCPRKEDIHPCVCDSPSSQTAYITCSGLDNEQDLVNAATAFSGKDYIYSVTIENSNFNFIPSDAFKGSKFVELEIKTSSLMALTDTEVAFNGLEDTLEILMMHDTTFMNEWDWHILRKLKNLMRLEISNCDLDNIGEDLVKINLTRLTDISFNDNRISFVYDHAFATFENLRILSFSHNEIVEMKRSMLPNPASELIDIDLSYNKIEKFPDDLFTNMPKLENLAIGYNKILVLNENIFSPVWEQLEFFSAMGNDLRCDCRMSWILGKRFPRNMRSICAMPQELKGKSLDSLSSKDLWCYFGEERDI